MRALYAVTGILALLSTTMFVPQTQADTTAATPVAAQQPAALPQRGLTMQQVEQKFGAPQQKIAAVGEPPISRWLYADYTVYFEHQFVIHAVANKKLPAGN